MRRGKKKHVLGIQGDERKFIPLFCFLHDKLILFSHLVGLELGEADGEVDGFPLIDGVPLGCDDMEG